MDTRRLRNHRHSQMLAEARWWGWVLLMMFVLVQVANTGIAEGLI